MSEKHNKPQRILVADDDPAVLRFLRTVIETEGYMAITAREGKEAYKLLQSEGPFVVAVLDVIMPHIEGTDLVKYMQSERRLMKIPVIMMTAAQNPCLSSESFSAGAVAFLPKPFSDSQLKTMLRMFIKRGQTEAKEMNNRPDRNFERRNHRQ